MAMHVLMDPAEATRRWNNERSALWRGWNQGFWLDAAVANVPPNKPGAYVLGLAHGETRSVAIPRLCGTDPHGVLDIGESKNLKKRLEQLHGCMTNPGAAGHMAGWRYSFLQLQAHLTGKLYVCWCIAENSYDLEGKMLWAYTSAFRELPPLNYKFNWSRMR